MTSETIASIDLNFHKWECEVNLELNMRDMWIGLYWEFKDESSARRYNFFVCVIPMLPIHVYIVVPKKEK